jgi:hypothetical protein
MIEEMKKILFNNLNNPLWRKTMNKYAVLLTLCFLATGSCMQAEEQKQTTNEVPACTSCSTCNIDAVPTQESTPTTETSKVEQTAEGQAAEGQTTEGQQVAPKTEDQTVKQPEEGQEEQPEMTEEEFQKLLADLTKAIEEEKQKAEQAKTAKTDNQETTENKVAATANQATNVA